MTFGSLPKPQEKAERKAEDEIATKTAIVMANGNCRFEPALDENA